MQQDSHPPVHPHRHAPPSKGLGLDSIEGMFNRRLRMLMRHTWLIAIFSIFVFAGLVGVALYFSDQPTRMRFAVGPRDSADVKFVELLAEKFKNEHASIQIIPVLKDAPVGAKDVVAGKPDFDLAVIRSNLAISQGWPVVAILRQNTAVLMVPAPGARDAKKVAARKGAAGKIEKVSDLAGRRVGIVQSEASPDLLRDILEQYEVPLERVEVFDVPPQNLKNMIRDNQVDAILVAGPVTGKAIAETVAAASYNKQAPTFIEIDQAEAIAQRITAYEKFSIVSGSFGGSPAKPEEDMDSVNFPQYIVARRSLDEGKIATFAKLLYTSRQSLAHALPGVVKIEKPSTDKDSAVLVHPGADAYLGDNLKTFFERYGDPIFYGLLIFPVFGSALAALAGYLRVNTSTRRLRLLHRLLLAAKKAHGSETLEALNELQAAVDGMVTEAIHQAERDQLGETEMMTFSMAINEARIAIAARRSELLLHPISETAQVIAARSVGAPQQVTSPRQAKA